MSTKEEDDRVEILQGTLDLLILRTLAPGAAHGHAIAKAIERNSDEILQVEQGSLYPALHRLIKRGWISAEEGVSENNRRAKFYRLTAKGRRQLTIETTKWEKLAAPSRASCGRPGRRDHHEPRTAHARRDRARSPRTHRNGDAGKSRSRDAAG
jgi:transcriptional regulator